jgi:aspartate/methionine/tyrosine aminotransferase
MAGANVIRVPLGNDQAFLDRCEQVIEGLYPKPKMLILNYPHNPTAMTIDPWFWEKAIEMCRRHGVMIISDFAYGEINFDGYGAPSFLSAPGAKEIGVEFTTMSKSYNMAGWRVGFCCGNGEMVKALATIKGYYDYGMFAGIQIASVIAMRECKDTPQEQSKIYRAPPRRRLRGAWTSSAGRTSARARRCSSGPGSTPEHFQAGRRLDRVLPPHDGRGGGRAGPRPRLRRARRRRRPHRPGRE